LHTTTIERRLGTLRRLQAAMAIGKEQFRVAMQLPELAQGGQRRCRQGHEAIPVALGVADLDAHPGGIDVADFEGQPFAQAQPQAVLIAQFPPGQLDEDVFQIRRAVHVAQAVGAGQRPARGAVRDNRRRRFRRWFRRARPAGGGRRRRRAGRRRFVEDLDDLRFDLFGDQLPRAAFGDLAP
jgi:hypothetical protein